VIGRKEKSTKEKEGNK